LKHNKNSNHRSIRIVLPGRKQGRFPRLWSEKRDFENIYLQKKQRPRGGAPEAVY